MRLLVAGILTVFSMIATADAFLPVPHRSQETPLWCWVAAAQQIIAFKRGAPATPRQCEMVEVASGFPPGSCCVSGLPACVHGGNFIAVANLIAYYGGSYSTYVLPASPYIIDSTLNAGRPILAQIVSGPGSTHVVVIVGIQMAPVPMLIINDPMQPGPTTIPFAYLVGVWMDGIVVN